MTAIDMKVDRRTISWIAVAIGLVVAIIVTIMVFPPPFGWIYAIAIGGPLFVSIIGIGVSLFGMADLIRKADPPSPPWQQLIEEEKKKIKEGIWSKLFQKI
jgi:hypothetical protein